MGRQRISAGPVRHRNPQEARIVAIVDAYDALTHDRVYRPAMSEEEAMAILPEGAEKQFDPVLLATFFRRLPEMRRLCRQNADHATAAAAGRRICRRRPASTGLADGRTGVPGRPGVRLEPVCAPIAEPW